MDLYEVESKIKELEASYNKEADNLMQELNAYKKKNPILPMYGDDPNVDKMIANKNRIIRSQYTRRENKIHKLWEKFYDDVTDIVTAEYNLPTDVAKLVVQQVRDRDIGRSELASYLDHYANGSGRCVLTYSHPLRNGLPWRRFCEPLANLCEVTKIINNK